MDDRTGFKSTGTLNSPTWTISFASYGQICYCRTKFSTVLVLMEHYKGVSLRNSDRLDMHHPWSRLKGTVSTPVHAAPITIKSHFNWELVASIVPAPPLLRNIRISTVAKMKTVQMLVLIASPFILPTSGLSLPVQVSKPALYSRRSTSGTRRRVDSPLPARGLISVDQPSQSDESPRDDEPSKHVFAHFIVGNTYVSAWTASRHIYYGF